MEDSLPCSAGGEYLVSLADVREEDMQSFTLLMLLEVRLSAFDADDSINACGRLTGTRLRIHQ
jgi:hypothetical protein